jgi:hypothetical protein
MINERNVAQHISRILDERVDSRVSSFKSFNEREPTAAEFNAMMKDEIRAFTQKHKIPEGWITYDNEQVMILVPVSRRRVYTLVDIAFFIVTAAVVAYGIWKGFLSEF